MKLSHPFVKAVVCAGFVCSLACTQAWSEEPLIAKSLAKLGQSPPECDGSFDFIVTGDSQSNRQIVDQREVFKQMIREFNVLRPALVVEVGDLILGGGAENVPPQWELFQATVGNCEPPYFPVPGNHDIGDAQTEKYWMEQMGPTRYAFSYGNSRFIVLDSEEVDALDRLSDEQVQWFRNELETTNARNIFVFLHQPYFTYKDEPERSDEAWEKRWKYLADVMKGHPVRAVFAGHLHGYQDFGIREGVHYVIAAGAAGFGQAAEETGRFNHYLLVRVRGEEVSWAVIKPYSVLPENVVTADRIDELYNVRNKWVASSEVFAPLGEPVDQEMTLTIRNPHDTPLKSSLTWDPKPGWTIEPETADYEVAAKGSTDLLFHVRADKPGDARFPVPRLHTRYSGTVYGPPVDVEQDLPYVPVLSAVRAKGAVNTDGVLDEWASAQMMPLIYPVGFDAADSKDLTSRLGFMWDDDHLYLAIETHDNEHYQPYGGDIVWSADAVEMFLDNWSWGLSLTKAGPEVFLYWGVDVSGETINTDVKLGITRNGDKITYEAAFPNSLLKPLALAEGNSFRYNALMNDLDSSGPLPGRHWLQLVPERGAQGSKPRVKVVLSGS